MAMAPIIHRPRRWYSPTSIGRSVAIRPRLYFSALAGISALIFLPGSWSGAFRGAVAWDLSAAIYLLLAFRIMLTCAADVIRARAARQDNSRVVILVIILFMGYTVGAGGGGSIASALAAQFGWRAAFWMGGLTPLVVVAILLRLVERAGSARADIVEAGIARQVAAGCAAARGRVVTAIDAVESTGERAGLMTAHRGADAKA